MTNDCPECHGAGWLGAGLAGEVDPGAMGDEGEAMMDAQEEIGSLESENRDLKAEVAELNKEVSELREKVDELEVTLDDEEAGNVETLEAWKHQKAEVERLRKTLESIQTTLRQGFGDQYMLNRIKSLVDDVIDGHGLENAVVTDDDGEPD